MYECVTLTRRNIREFHDISEKRHEFNVLNEDFFDVYDNSNFAQQLFLRRTVKLLKKDSNYLGYIWIDREDKYTSVINSMAVMDSEKSIECYKMLINSVKKTSVYRYQCESNKYNTEILKSLGFVIKDGTIELRYVCNSIPQCEMPSNIKFHKFVEGKDELMRCRIQNEVFKSNSRIPITVEDIYYDENQKYYMDEGAIFIKNEEKYVGYGQIINENSEPVIVNVGILEEFRGNGYGKYLLIYLLQTIMNCGYKTARIKVSEGNNVALSLYKGLGFKILYEKYIWELKRPNK